jgi:hypothetical protein
MRLKIKKIEVLFPNESNSSYTSSSYKLKGKKEV